MRTSRGLQVTCLVVLSPVLLILLTLLSILITTVFSQLQSLCPPLYETSPTLSKWMSTTSYSLVYMNDTVLPLIQDASSTPFTIDNSSTNTNITSYRSSSLIQTWLKRWRYSKRKSPALWALCTCFLFICYIYSHKNQVQKRQSYQSVIKWATLITRTLCDLIYQSKKGMIWFKHVWNGLWYQDKMGSMNKKIKKNARGKNTTSSGTTLRTKKIRKHHQSYQHQRSSIHAKQPYTPPQPQELLDPATVYYANNKTTMEPLSCVMEDNTVIEPLKVKDKVPHVIHHWYSPFSTGLDLDIAPRLDQLAELDPLRSPIFTTPDRQLASLLQYHPFVTTHSPSRHPPPLFGPIGPPPTCTKF